jgi:hypothetical protein
MGRYNGEDAGKASCKSGAILPDSAPNCHSGGLFFLYKPEILPHCDKIAPGGGQVAHI